MLKRIEEEQWFYILEHDDETDEYFLDVCCGTVAIYTIKIRLNADESEEFLRDPASIKTLAYRISDYPNEYIERRID